MGQRRNTRSGRPHSGHHPLRVTIARTGPRLASSKLPPQQPYSRVHRGHHASRSTAIRKCRVAIHNRWGRWGGAGMEADGRVDRFAALPLSRSRVEAPPLVAHAFPVARRPGSARSRNRLDPNGELRLYVVVRNDRSTNDVGLRQTTDPRDGLRWARSVGERQPGREPAPSRSRFRDGAAAGTSRDAERRAKLEPKESGDADAKASIRENFLGKSHLLDARGYRRSLTGDLRARGGPESVQVQAASSIHRGHEAVTTTMNGKGRRPRRSRRQGRSSSGDRLRIQALQGWRRHP
jgi:hypothetical protein